ncbi:catecholate siderophore receptor [Novosphingobium sp. GV055]|nr:catecholate siderophore receptor [Novosphingobium sp. GV055]PUB02164.1 catecholate siderophore receptor [Novosphingobium sp. GV061]PUB18345.1 catecholate siderophore receptor [Novosphingobium sp. GV079]PUB40597.1 catecholate siderophore receptor [Novosphingobium sp. GV027]
MPSGHVPATSPLRPAFLAAGCIGVIAAMPAQAQDAAQTVLGGVTVTDTAIAQAPVKVERAESPKYVRPLLDTPQTVTVVGRAVIEAQNLLSLKDALSILPGITLGAGEGGGGYGDSINLRGQSANTDIQIDGVRDSAQYSRSDLFNIEQVEVTNGANSVFSGSGSIGGTVNLVSKRPKDETSTTVQGGVGTANYWRGTVDSNWQLGSEVAVRLNAMGHSADVPGRDFEYSRRWGVAPSVKFGLTGDTSLTLLYLHQRDKNIPQYGVPYYAVYGGLLPGASYAGYYGYKNYDRQEQTVDQATAILDHRFSDAVSIRNLARYQKVKQDTFVDPPQGAWCLANGTLANSTGAATACSSTQAAGTFYPSGPRGLFRLTDTSIWYDQVDLSAKVSTFGLEHTLALGAAYSQEDYDVVSGNGLRNANGTTPTLDAINIANPNAIYTGPVNYITTAIAHGSTRNIALYAFDAVKLGGGFEVNGGIRWENNRARYRSDTLAVSGAVTTGAPQNNTDDLFSYRLGLVYKPVANASLYVAYGNSKTPASSTVRSGCGVTSTTLLGDPCNVAPQTAVNFELGGKVDLAQGKLQLTASVFRNERTNYPVAANDPLVGTTNVLDGRSQVDGVSLGLSGKITPAWTIFANAMYLDGVIKQSISNYCKNHLGATQTLPTGGTVTCPTSDVQAGNPVTNTPRWSGSLYTSYHLPFGLEVGYGLTYQGSWYLTNSTGAPMYKAPSYLTHRISLGYKLDNGLSAQINVQNLTDEKYYTSIRNNGWAVPGEGRSAVLTLGYAF